MNIRTVFEAALPALVAQGIIVFDEPLHMHCTFRIGGPAEVFASPLSIIQLTDILSIALTNRIDYFIIGKGSNLLISDKGVTGVVISTSRLERISHEDNYISAWSGVTLAAVAQYAMERGLSGLEFAAGIPGSVGGAVFMNAGAYGGEICDILYCSKYLVPKLEHLHEPYPVKHLTAREHQFAYRSSVFQRSDFIHLGSVFCLRMEDPDAIAEKMRELEEQRWSKQPMELPSAGSVFKRPQGHFTGKLIDECGLRGFRIGGAAVSDKHCGFIVNLGGATAADVLAVIKHVMASVKERFGVELELELRLIGNT